MYIFIDAKSSKKKHSDAFVEIKDNDIQQNIQYDEYQSSNSEMGPTIMLEIGNFINININQNSNFFEIEKINIYDTNQVIEIIGHIYKCATPSSLIMYIHNIHESNKKNRYITFYFSHDKVTKPLDLNTEIITGVDPEKYFNKRNITQSLFNIKENYPYPKIETTIYGLLFSSNLLISDEKKQTYFKTGDCIRFKTEIGPILFKISSIRITNFIEGNLHVYGIKKTKFFSVTGNFYNSKGSLFGDPSTFIYNHNIDTVILKGFIPTIVVDWCSLDLYSKSCSSEAVSHEDLIHENPIHEDLIHENPLHNDPIDEDSIDDLEVEEDVVEFTKEGNTLIATKNDITKEYIEGDIIVFSGHDGRPQVYKIINIGEPDEKQTISCVYWGSNEKWTLTPINIILKPDVYERNTFNPQDIILEFIDYNPKRLKLQRICSSNDKFMRKIIHAMQTHQIRHDNMPVKFISQFEKPMIGNPYVEIRNIETKKGIIYNINNCIFLNLNDNKHHFFKIKSIYEINTDNINFVMFGFLWNHEESVWNAQISWLYNYKHDIETNASTIYFVDKCQGKTYVNPIDMQSKQCPTKNYIELGGTRKKTKSKTKTKSNTKSKSKTITKSKPKSKTKRNY